MSNVWSTGYECKLTTADMNLRLAGQEAVLTAPLLTAVESGSGRWWHCGRVLCFWMWESQYLKVQNTCWRCGRTDLKRRSSQKDQPCSMLTFRRFRRMYMSTYNIHYMIPTTFWVSNGTASESQTENRKYLKVSPVFNSWGDFHLS